MLIDSNKRLPLAAWVPARYQKLQRLLSESDARSESTILREWIRKDLWFLLWFVMGRQDLYHPWMLARCEEVQERPDGFLDLWPRDHRKSTIITFGKTIQDILASHGMDPLPHWDGLEPTFCIFSHSRPIAKSFLRQIKTELESNALLIQLFPDVLYPRPQLQAPRWSEDSGLIVKRKTNPKEATIEAWGLVDGQPTGKHFNVLIWDDTVDRESVSNPDMIAKTTDAWALSVNLGDRAPRKRAIGTRWHFADTYRAIMDRGALIPRIRPGTSDGTLTGTPVYLTQEQWDDKVRDMGPYLASAQLLLNPIADSKMVFQRDWLEHRFDRERVNWQGMNRVLLCDPASGKKKSDFTTMAVVGLGPDHNYYLLDLLRDRLGLTARGKQYLLLHQKWQPLLSGYEEYGLQADIEYLKTLMESETYTFHVEPMKGKLGKFDRINRLIPMAQARRLWFPKELYRTNVEGKLEELIDLVIEQEFLCWPVPLHDDALDVISRVFDLEPPWPMLEVIEKDDRYRAKRRGGSWMKG